MTSFRRAVVITGLAAACGAAACVPAMVVHAAAAPALSTGSARLGTVVGDRIVPKPQIKARAEWFDALPEADKNAPRPPVEHQRAKFVILDHSSDSNDYPVEAVPKLIREKFLSDTQGLKYRDVMPNFFVDRFGNIWEGRAGSVERSMRSEGPGAGVGHNQVIMLLGDFSKDAPSREAVEATQNLAAWIAQRDGIDMGRPSSVKFESMGTDTHKPGAPVGPLHPLVAMGDLFPLPKLSFYDRINREFRKAVSEKLGHKYLETPAPPALTNPGGNDGPGGPNSGGSTPPPVDSKKPVGGSNGGSNPPRPNGNSGAGGSITVPGGGGGRPLPMRPSTPFTRPQFPGAGGLGSPGAGGLGAPGAPMTVAPTSSPTTTSHWAAKKPGSSTSTTTSATTTAGAGNGQKTQFPAALVLGGAGGFVATTVLAAAVLHKREKKAPTFHV